MSMIPHLRVSPEEAFGNERAKFKNMNPLVRDKPQKATLLHFEEKRPKAPSKLIHQTEQAVNIETHQVVHRENEDNNVAVEAAQRGEEGAEHAMRSKKRMARNLRERRSRPGQVEEKTPCSKAQHKKAIKHRYAKESAKTAREGTFTGSKVKAFADRAGKTIHRSVDAFRKQPRKALLVLGIFFSLSMLLNIASSCSLMIGGIGPVVSGTTYPSRDADMLAAEQEYCAMEAQLQNSLDNYERDHDYDKYEFELDEIGHDPYVLISTLTALHGGEWTIGEVRETLQWLFQQQYELIETESIEKKPDPDNPDVVKECVSVKVKMTNKKLSHLQYELMNESQLSMYSLFMTTLGNRPDLFPGSEYVGRYGEGSVIHYDIPPEALADEKFAAMLREAEKYLGYPYVWGGSSPSTSFDCSGFVCWVLNHSGWNVGRTTAQGLCDYCTPVRATEARPGDLVFFVGTYDTPGVSHVGIYVGNNMMIHCGDPITYANLNSVYWQQHLYCYGRLP